LQCTGTVLPIWKVVLVTGTFAVTLRDDAPADRVMCHQETESDIPDAIVNSLAN
jgi:hypothetical protein